jgi:hypothetical protein
VRYEYFDVLHDVNNKAVIFDISKGDVVAGTSTRGTRARRRTSGRASP